MKEKEKKKEKEILEMLVMTLMLINVAYRGYCWDPGGIDVINMIDNETLNVHFVVFEPGPAVERLRACPTWTEPASRRPGVLAAILVERLRGLPTTTPRTRAPAGRTRRRGGGTVWGAACPHGPPTARGPQGVTAPFS